MYRKKTITPTTDVPDEPPLATRGQPGRRYLAPLSAAFRAARGAGVEGEEWLRCAECPPCPEGIDVLLQSGCELFFSRTSLLVRQSDVGHCLVMDTERANTVEPEQGELDLASLHTLATLANQQGATMSAAALFLLSATWGGTLTAHISAANMLFKLGEARRACAEYEVLLAHEDKHPGSMSTTVRQLVERKRGEARAALAAGTTTASAPTTARTQQKWWRTCGGQKKLADKVTKQFTSLGAGANDGGDYALARIAYAAAFALTGRGTLRISAANMTLKIGGEENLRAAIEEYDCIVAEAGRDLSAAHAEMIRRKRAEAEAQMALEAVPFVRPSVMGDLPAMPRMTRMTRGSVAWLPVPADDEGEPAAVGAAPDAAATEVTPLPEKTAVKFADNVGAPEETGKAETVTGADQTEEQAAETAILVATRVARARRASASASNLMAETTVQDRLARARSNAEAAAGEAEYETEGPVQAVEE